MAAKKTPKKSSSAKSPQQRGAETKKYNAEVSAGNAVREAHRQANPERYKELHDALHESWQSDAGLTDRIKRAGFDPGTEMEKHRNATQKMGVGSAYRAMGWTNNEQEHAANHPMQGVLFQGDHLMDNPNRWEDRKPQQQEATLKAAAKYGVTLESLHNAYSTQLDRGHVREGGQHQSFYSQEGTAANGALSPRSRLIQSAKENDVSFHIQRTANAITSPQNKFVLTKDEKTSYPNDEAATGAIKWAQSGRTGEEYEYHPDYYVPPEDKVPNRNGKMVKAKDDPRKYPHQGYPRNHAQAIDVASSMLKGATIRQAWNPKEAAKVAPYANAWGDPNAPEGNFLVSDTHSGGEGFAPHVAAQGKEAEGDYLSISGIHALHDYVARQVHAERGLTSVSRNQSTQWNQAKYEGGDTDDVENLTHSNSNLNSQQFSNHIKGQGTMF